MIFSVETVVLMLFDVLWSSISQPSLHLQEPKHHWCIINFFFLCFSRGGCVQSDNVWCCHRQFLFEDCSSLAPEGNSSYYLCSHLESLTEMSAGEIKTNSSDFRDLEKISIRKTNRYGLHWWIIRAPIYFWLTKHAGTIVVCVCVRLCVCVCYHRFLSNPRLSQAGFVMLFQSVEGFGCVFYCLAY